MAQPSPYRRATNFKNFQTGHPSTPLPGQLVDEELNRVAAVIDQIRANLAKIQRDDTELANSSVGLDQLKPEVLIGMNAPTTWATGVKYTPRDTVFIGLKLYMCEKPHTSGDFDTDLSQGRWELLADFGVPGILDRANHTGTQSADTITDGVDNKVFTAAEKTKLGGIATGATANSSDAALINRANHTGTQSADTIVDGTANKAFTAAEKTKLAGIAAGATSGVAAATPAFLVHRTNAATNALIEFRNSAGTQSVFAGMGAEGVFAIDGDSNAAATPKFTVDTANQVVGGTVMATQAEAVAGTATGKLPDVVRVKQALNAAGIVTPQMYGAKGDGTTNDTAAIQAMLDTTAKHIHFPMGSYRIVDSPQNGTAALISTVHKRRITMDGTLTASSHVYKMLQVDGDDCTIQVNIDGANNCAHGLVTNGARPQIEGCRIENLKTTVYSSIGITVKTTAGCIIRSNIIRNLESVGDATAGNGNGFCRAILLDVTGGNATQDTLIEGNLCQNVIGEEGDSITIAGSAGSGSYYKAKAIICGNVIDTFTRRGVKIQAHEVQTIDNTFRSSWTSSTQIPNRQHVIAVIQGNDQTIRGNILDGCEWFGQIVFNADPGESFSRVWVEDNIIKNLTAATTNGAISITSRGSDVYIRRNTVTTGLGRAISVGSTANVVIDSNVVYAADNGTERTISVSSDNSNVIVSGNIMMAGARRSFIEVDCTDAIVAGNHNRANTPTYRSGSNKNNLVTDNSAFGDSALLAVAADHTGNRIGPNYTLGNPQTNTHPGLLYCTTAAGPATQLAGLFVRVGQIVLDTTPTANGKIGWTAMDSGLAESVTWKQFGVIDP